MRRDKTLQFCTDDGHLRRVKFVMRATKCNGRKTIMTQVQRKLTSVQPYDVYIASNVDVGK